MWISQSPGVGERISWSENRKWHGKVSGRNFYSSWLEFFSCYDGTAAFQSDTVCTRLPMAATSAGTSGCPWALPALRHGFLRVIGKTSREKAKVNILTRKCQEPESVAWAKGVVRTWKCQSSKILDQQNFSWRLGMVAYAFNPCTEETGQSFWVWSQPGIHREFRPARAT